MDIHELLAAVLWSMLGLSILLTFYGFWNRSALVFAIAAMLSLVFAIAAMFSIGIFILPLTILQIVMAVRSSRATAQPPTTS